MREIDESWKREADESLKRVEREIWKREPDKKVREESWTKELYLFSLKSLIFVG